MTESAIAVQQIEQYSKIINTYTIATVIAAVAIFCGLLILFAFIFTFKGLLKKVLDNQDLREISNTLKGFADQIEHNTRAIENGNAVLDRLDYLESKTRNIESAYKKNLILFIRNIFKHIELHATCIQNIEHNKTKCPFPDNVLCQTVDNIKDIIKREIEVYILEDILKDRIYNVIETYIQPDKPIKTYITQMLKEIENIIK